MAEQIKKLTAERDEYIVRLTAALGLLNAETQIEAELNLADLKAERGKLKAALEKSREDINWMLNSQQFLNPFVFNYIDEALKGLKCATTNTTTTRAM